MANRVDDRSVFVLLLFVRDVLAFGGDQPLLLAALALSRLWNRRDELRLTPRLDHALRGLSLRVQLPVPLGTVVGRVQDGSREEVVAHCEAMLARNCRLPNRGVASWP